MTKRYQHNGLITCIDAARRVTDLINAREAGELETLLSDWGRCDAGG